MEMEEPFQRIYQSLPKIQLPLIVLTCNVEKEKETEHIKGKTKNKKTKKATSKVKN